MLYLCNAGSINPVSCLLFESQSPKQGTLLTQKIISLYVYRYMRIYFRNYIQQEHARFWRYTGCNKRYRSEILTANYLAKDLTKY